jgi:hypothetical protein
MHNMGAIVTWGDDGQKITTDWKHPARLFMKPELYAWVMTLGVLP